MLDWFYAAVSNFPVIETLVFLVLALITVFRKELSSNDQYRNPTNPNKLPSLPTMPAMPSLPTMPAMPSLPSLPRVPSLNTLNQLSLDDCKSALVSTVEVAKDTIEEAGSQAFTTAWDKYISPVLEANPNGDDLPEFEVRSMRKPSKHGSIIHRLSEDLLVKLVDYLSNGDIRALALVSKQLSKFMLSDLVWEHLWIQCYGDMWRSPAIVEIRQLRRILWDPFANWGPPGQGWFRFYIQFEISWLNWLLAGLCTSDKCLVGINNSIYDVTAFVPLHPGSPEVMLDFSGFDATAVYDDIGHSHQARLLSEKYLIWGDGDAASTGTPMSAFGGEVERVGFGRLHRGRQSGRGRSRHLGRSVESGGLKSELSWLTRPVNKDSQLFRYMRDMKKAIKAKVEAQEESSSFDDFSELISSAGSTLGSTIETGMSIGSSLSSTLGTTLGTGISIGSTISSTLGSTIGSGLTLSSNLSSSITGAIFNSRSPQLDSDILVAADQDDVASAAVSAGLNPDPMSLPDVDVREETTRALPSLEIYLSSSQVNVAGPGSRDSTVEQRRLVPSLAGAYTSPTCCHLLGHNHSGQVRVTFDPLEQQWIVWWTCCGIYYPEE